MSFHLSSLPLLLLFLLALAATAPHARASITRQGDLHIATAAFDGAMSDGKTVAVQASYHLWLPPGAKTIRAIIVHQHGAGQGASADGPRVALDLHWRELAAKWDCALLGPQYLHVVGGAPAWSGSDRGSERVFLAALAEFARELGRPELATAPWVLWGHSAGGGWSTGMARKHPARIVALALKSGGGLAERARDQPLQLFAFEGPLRDVPVLSIYGQGELDGDNPGYRASFTRSREFCEKWRAAGGLVAFAAVPGQGHECGNARFLAIPFLDACLAQRLPAPGETALRTMNPAAGWLVDPAARKIFAANAAPTADPLTLGWLPDECTARAWQTLVATGGLADTTPPLHAPVITAVTRPTITTIEIAWTARADLESGIRHFEIWRGDKKIAETTPGPGRSAIEQFQPIGYHDTPVEGSPAMAFRYVTASAQRGSYRVVMVNGVGLRSEPSAPMTAPSPTSREAAPELAATTRSFPE